jgi:hypothetical protein
VAGGRELTRTPDWLERRTGHAPPALRERVRAYAALAGGSSPEALASAGQRALSEVLAHAGDRRVALDLLAADGLITLALLAQAEQSPQDLRRFAASLLDSGVLSGD